MEGQVDGNDSTQHMLELESHFSVISAARPKKFHKKNIQKVLTLLYPVSNPYNLLQVTLTIFVEAN